MGIIVRQDDHRSELQKRVATQLAEKAKKKADPKGDLPDGVEDSAYIKGTTGTSSWAWVWIVIAVVAVGAAVWYFLSTAK